MSLADLKKRVAAPIAELLKARGFRKSGLTFTAMRDNATLLVNLQSSTGSTKDVLKITCNLGIRLNQLAKESGSGVWDTHWRERIGTFMTEPRDFWWTCANNEDADRAGREIAALLRDCVLPEMERLAAPAELAKLWKSGRSPGLTEGQRTRYLTELNTAGITTVDERSR